MKNEYVLSQEKGYAFGQAVQIASRLLAERARSIGEEVGRPNEQDNFRTNIKALYYTILAARQDIRDDEAKEEGK